MGWTGDAAMFVNTAAFNFDVNNFFAKWMKDVAADQFSNGAMPFLVPNVFGQAGGAAVWGDVATIVPWTLYLRYGNKAQLGEQYKSMKAWVDYMQSRSKNDLWQSNFQFGDWLFYRPNDDNDGRSAVTDKYLIAQCFYAHSTQLLIKSAAVLGNSADSATYTQLLQKIKAAFVKEYMTSNGRISSNTQTAYTLALVFDMLPMEKRQQAATRLAQNIKEYDYHLTTGFVGTPFILFALSKYGYTDVAYKLLEQKTYSSWLYPITKGATTIWERWDGIKEDGIFQTPAMNSFNHYAYGAVGDWLYRLVGGIDNYEDGPAYKHSKIQPTPGVHLPGQMRVWKHHTANYLLTGEKKETAFTSMLKFPVILLAKSLSRHCQIKPCTKTVSRLLRP